MRASVAVIVAFTILSYAHLLAAQEVKSSYAKPVASDGVPWYRRAINFFFFDIDTNYIATDRYRMNVALRSDITCDNYTLREGRGDDYRALTISQSPGYTLGIYAGWEVITAGWSVNIAEVLDDGDPGRRNTDYRFSLMGTFIGCDLYYRNYLDGFEITRSEGLGLDSGNDRQRREVEGVEARVAGFNAWYIFNRRRLAYPAVYAHSSRQKRSCGSVMLGLSYTLHDFDIDAAEFPDDYDDFMERHSELTHVSYHNVSLGVGYTYNFAFLGRFTANVTLLPSVSYHISRLEQTDDCEPIYKNLNCDVLAKGGVTYNTGRFFAGCTGQFRMYLNRHDRAAIVNNSAVVSLFMGINFWSKK